MVAHQNFNIFNMFPYNAIFCKYFSFLPWFSIVEILN